MYPYNALSIHLNQKIITKVACDVTIPSFTPEIG